MQNTASKLTLITLFILTSYAFCQNQDELTAEEPKTTLPVIIHKSYMPESNSIKKITENTAQLKILPEKFSSAPNIINKDISTEELNIDYEKIKDIVFKIKKELCEINEAGSYEVWLTFNASGGVFVNVGADTGFKATINCK